MNTIEFVHKLKQVPKFSNNSLNSRIEHLEFMVSGKPLRGYLQIEKFDLIGSLGWTKNIQYEIKKINEFLGIEGPELKTLRSCFYVCPECGDIGCGAITAKIQFMSEQVIWKEFGFEDNLSGPNLESYSTVGPFIFDREEYSALFESLKKQLSFL